MIKDFFTKTYKRLSNKDNSDLREKLISMPEDDFTALMMQVLTTKSLSLKPKDSLKFLFQLENEIYILQGKESIRYGNGVHSKHKHIKYHDFFTSNIAKGDKVLDIGSSFGELVSDIAKKASPGKVVGVEIIKEKVEQAKENYKQKNLKFVHGDATKVLPDEKFDVITLSNVLEHIAKREEMLKTLIKKYKPKKLIIRVPTFERDWRVPLKKELKMEYRLDKTHFIEYLVDDFKKEMNDSGLSVDKLDIKWGEIWAVLKPKK